MRLTIKKALAWLVFALLITVLVGRINLVSARVIQFGPDSGGGGVMSIPIVQEWSDSCQNGRVSFQTFTAGCDQGNSDNLFTSLYLAFSKSLLSMDYSGEVTSDGAVQKMFSLVNNMALNEPPVSSGYYLADLGKNLGFNLVPETYAQETNSVLGIGFSAFAAVLKLWRAFADIAFGLMAIIFLVIGFLIMFRSKLSAQTEITIQSALPRLAVTIFLIAFSYPIAGFMIDLMYLVIYAFIGFLGTSHLIDKTVALQQVFTSHPFNILLGKGFVSRPTDTITDSVGSLVSQQFGGLVGFLANNFVSSAFFMVLLVIFLLFISFKIFIILLKAYAYILMQVILAPIYILGNAFPGSSACSSWLKGLIAKLAVFPIVIFHIIIAAILVGATGWGASENLFSGSGSRLWSPPLMNFGVTTTGFDGILAIVALGILYMAPNAAEMAEQLLKGQFNINVGQSMGGAVQQFAYPAKQYWQRRERRKSYEEQARAMDKYRNLEERSK